MTDFGITEQWDWVEKRAYKDPYFAQREFDIRRQATEVMQRLYQDDGPPSVNVAIMSPATLTGIEFSTITIHKAQVARMGGLEGVLVVEEMIRRAMGLSVERDLEERLEQIRGAL